MFERNITTSTDLEPNQVPMTGLLTELDDPYGLLKYLPKNTVCFGLVFHLPGSNETVMCGDLINNDMAVYLGTAKCSKSPVSDIPTGECATSEDFF